MSYSEECLCGFFLAGSRSSSPGKLLGSAYGGLNSGAARGSPVPSPSDKRSKVPRSQGCSRETSPNRIGLGKISLTSASQWWHFYEACWQRKNVTWQSSCQQNLLWFARGCSNGVLTKSHRLLCEAYDYLLCCVWASLTLGLSTKTSCRPTLRKWVV